MRKGRKRRLDFFGTQDESLFKKAKRTSSGRFSRVPPKFQAYQLEKIQPKSRGYFNLAFLYDQKGQAYIEAVGGKDDLKLVDLLINHFDDVLSPLDVLSKVSENGTPIKETQTPRKRQFKHLLEVTVQVGELTSVLAFYQVPNAQALLERRPPVYPSPSKFNPLTPPKNSKKTVSGAVSIEDIKKHKKRGRVNASTFFNRNSANSVSQEAGQDDKERYAHSHLVPVHQAGELGREAIVTATDGQNITQMAFENAIDKMMGKLKGKLDVLYFYAEATLMRGEAGKLTHVAETQKLSYASPRKTTSVEAKFNSQNPNRATASLSEAMDVLIDNVFAGDSRESGSETEESSEQSPSMELEAMKPTRLDFMSL